jgi:GNAT superfamily N-acetyltransferase
MTTIRRATRNDVPSIAVLYSEDELGAHPKATDPAAVEAYAEAFDEIERDSGTVIFVAESGDRVVGTFHLTLLRHLTYPRARTAQVESVCVARDARGQAIGEAMMRFAIAEALRLGCHRVQLTSNKARARAHRFYERLGFVASHEGFKMSLP